MRAEARSDVHLPSGTRAGWILLAVLVLLAAFALPYVLIDDEPDQLDEGVRGAADGLFVQLAAGFTH